ncbi:MAG: endonuclease MutS2 [Defluviitaleaceae bacterium]|nr:endonuclease MutS2 [Defluviitaleaceae bacterium]
MNTKALQTLEYTKIIELLTGYAVSEMGKSMAAELVPMTQLKNIERAQQETTESTTLILRKGSLPLGGIRDIRSSLQRALVGGMLNIEELLHVGDFLYVCGKIQDYGFPDERYEPCTLLQPLFDGVFVADSLENEIKRCILNQQELSDSASAALADIRRNIRNSNGRIRDHLNGLIHSTEYKNMLQETIITIRNDRYCVPVKAEYRGSFPGMIHDQSSSGATLFIEPSGVVQLNNKIKELFFEERKEIEKILLRLSGMVADQAELLSANIDMLTRLDFIFAKGELSLSMRGTQPIFNEKGFIDIRKGRHPLLSNDTVVPMDIYLGKDFTTLLITGPNTGGKTVSLKTIGLFTCMGQAGLHIPAFDNSELAVFSDVFADIGDEQSIEQSLSTFSSHMRNIVGILEKVQDNALVLLDELGAGTDPTEGAALAIAILQYLHDRQIRAVVTTHYSELKVYALGTPGVENASCEFDVETLRPTYRLLIGIPGKSNAFAISRRLGLPEHIIDHAKNVLSHEDIRFEDMITDLEISKKTVMMEKERAEQYRREAEKLQKHFETQQEKLKNQREKILQEAKAEALKLVREAKDQADEMYKTFQKQLRESASQKDIESSRQTMRDQLSGMEQEMQTSNAEKRKLKPLSKNLQKGDKVFVHSLNQTASIISPPDGNSEVMVQAGIMKIKVKLEDLSSDETAEKAAKSSLRSSANKSHSLKAGKARHISSEIDLRGLMVHEGTEKAEKYLDDAYLAGLGQVTLIHGKGTGALRKAIHVQLKRHPYVNNFRLGTFGEGEDGVTIVELK